MSHAPARCWSACRRGSGCDACIRTTFVKPVPLADVAALLPFVSPIISAMIRTQYFGGMRPAEVCAMRPCDIEQVGDVWIYRPESHTNTWRDQALFKAIPRSLHSVLLPFLENRDPAAFPFSPRESDEWHRAIKAAEVE